MNDKMQTKRCECFCSSQLNSCGQCAMTVIYSIYVLILAGGIFGMYDGRLNPVVASDKASETFIWRDLDKVPWDN